MFKKMLGPAAQYSPGRHQMFSHLLAQGLAPKPTVGGAWGGLAQALIGQIGNMRQEGALRREQQQAQQQHGMGLSAALAGVLPNTPPLPPQQAALMADNPALMQAYIQRNTPPTMDPREDPLDKVLTGDPLVFVNPETGEERLPQTYRERRQAFADGFRIPEEQPEYTPETVHYPDGSRATPTTREAYLEALQQPGASTSAYPAPSGSGSAKPRIIEENGVSYWAEGPNAGQRVLPEQAGSAGAEDTAPKSELTADQRDWALQAGNIARSLAILESTTDAGARVFDSLLDKSDKAADMVPFGLARGVQSPAFQKGKQAFGVIANALLRLESGGAITAGEIENIDELYMPKFGDTAPVVQQKLEGLKDYLGNILEGLPVDWRAHISQKSEPTSGIQGSGMMARVVDQVMGGQPGGQPPDTGLQIMVRFPDGSTAPVTSSQFEAAQRAGAVPVM